MQCNLNLDAAILPGGMDVDGQSLGPALNLHAVRAFARAARFAGYSHAALSGVFSPLHPSQVGGKIK